MIFEDFFASDTSIYGFPPLRFLKEGYLFIRLNKKFTKMMGPLYKPSRTRLSIDLTYSCNLKCPSCCRSCSQAPADEFISVSQVEKFIKESLKLNKKWERIDLIGGEPTLHPQFMEIFNLLYGYKMEHARETAIRLRSNMATAEYKAIKDKLPGDVVVKYQPKTAEFFNRNYYAFNVAPADLPMMGRMALENGCLITAKCGIGLNKYGFYICGNGASIDRIFGFNVGRKKIPSVKDDMRDQMSLLCRYCGAFHRCFEMMNMGRPYNKFAISSSWKVAYGKYAQKHPPLTLY